MTYLTQADPDYGSLDLDVPFRIEAIIDKTMLQQRPRQKFTGDGRLNAWDAGVA